MPKSKTEINPVSIERVKQVINESGMTQKDFAKKVLFYEQQTLSKIVNGKAPLTRESAARIAQYFEDINAAWLMGESDYKSKGEYSFYDDIIVAVQKENDALEALLDCSTFPDDFYINAFKLFLHSMGLTSKYVPLEDPSKENPFSTVQALCITDEYGNICAVFAEQEEYKIAREIADFAEFKIKKLIEGSKADG